VRFWDTSALVPLLVAESDSRRRIEQLRTDPVMSVWWATLIECESALQRRLREGSLSEVDARGARVRLGQLAAGWNEVIPTPSVRQLGVRILRTHPLRAADALQLAAALSLQAAGVPGLVFLSADARLAEAAEIEGLTVEM
jgi:predicted nucleic acid-binding protein